MATIGTLQLRNANDSEHLSHARRQLLSTRAQRICRLADALHALDDGALGQLGLARVEIERFAQAEVTHNL